MKKAQLLTLSLGFILTATSHSATTESKIALSYIKKLSQGKIDLTKHTALSPHCGTQRRTAIREKLDYLRKNIFSPKDTFSLETQKTEGNLAAVIIRVTHPSAPLSTRVHAIALIKKDTHWKPAPLPCSFTNTGYGYDEKIEHSVRTLEHWMAREKITRETQYRNKAKTDFKSTIATIEKKAALDTLEPEEAVMLLLKQCRHKNLLGILASMGAASDELTAPLETVINLVTQGINDKSTSSDWSIVTSTSAIAQVLKIDHTRHEVAVGFLNPLNRKKPRILYFPTHKSGGKTFVRLSPLLKITLLPANERWQEQWKHRRGDENELRKKLPSTILKNTPPITYPTPRKLIDHFLLALKNDKFTDCVSLLPRAGDYFSKEQNQTDTLLDLATLWANIHRLKTSPRHTPDIMQEESVALAPLQFEKTNHPGKFQTINVWMIKNSSGWHVIAQNTLDKPIGKELLTTAEKLKKHSLNLEKKHQEKHSRELLNKVVTLTTPLTLGPAKKEAAQKTLTTFLKHLRAKDTESALSSCAILKGTSNTQTLKAFNYAIRGASDHANGGLILSATHSGKWLGISARTESKLTRLHDYPLYLIVQTTLGPRILLDIDLRHPTNKGRKLLNKKNWRKLEAILPKASLENIKTLFTQHEKLTVKDIADHLKLQQ